MKELVKLVGSSIDTLILNVRYCDSKSQPIKQELDEQLARELDYLQGEARHVETAMTIVTPTGERAWMAFLPLDTALQEMMPPRRHRK